MVTEHTKDDNLTNKLEENEKGSKQSIKVTWHEIILKDHYSTDLYMLSA